MDRSSISRWLLIGGALLVAFLLMPRLCSNGNHALQPLTYESQKALEPESPEATCNLWTDRFHAELSTRGASLKHFRLLTAKYQRGGKPIDLSTTSSLPFHQQLRFDFRNTGAKVPDERWQVDYDLVDWKLEESTAKRCVFTYTDQRVALRKVVQTTEQPYELRVDAEIKNLSDAPRQHALAVHTTAWRTAEETKGQMFRVSPFITHVECMTGRDDAVRLRPEDFEAQDFKEKPEFRPTATHQGDWFEAPGTPRIAAVSNAYFTHAVVPLASAKQPTCQLQIEDRWDAARYQQPKDDPRAGAMYRARLAYPVTELAPGQAAEYSVLSFVGPKEREALATAGGEHNLTELIDLGFFSAIAKVLVTFLLGVHGVIPNWGIAIIVLTITARIVLFPLAVPSIRGMIKMRELKPEVDVINQKFKDDPQARGLAQMELWRKHKVNPLKGCLPQLASMPVWFALYTTLQTAVELYNIPFLWFPDLSQPDPWFILPFVIGGTTFVQQKLMPMQGDPAQQKMMLYFMPAMFTVFMLFLPAGLGVYMFTNGVIGIVQQQAVEWHARRSVKGGKPGGDIKVQFKEEEVAEGSAKTKKRNKRSDRPGPGESVASKETKGSKDQTDASPSLLLRKGKAES
jgi:YidC/Oxa1 family membrane protein insertase